MYSERSVNNLGDKALINHEQPNILYHWEAGILSCCFASVYNILSPLWQKHAVSHPSFHLWMPSSFSRSFSRAMCFPHFPCFTDTEHYYYLCGTNCLSCLTCAYVAGVLSFSQQALQLCQQEKGQMSSWNFKIQWSLNYDTSCFWDSTGRRK